MTSDHEEYSNDLTLEIFRNQIYKFTTCTLKKYYDNRNT